MCLVLIHSSGSKLPKPLESPTVLTVLNVLCYGNVVSFRKPLRMGLVVSGVNL